MNGGVTPQELLRRTIAVIQETMRHELAWPFNEPVDFVALNIPTYPDIIKNPMDLGTILNNLKPPNCKYKYLHQVVDHVQLVWKNCYTFNSARSEVSKMARTVSKKFERMYQERLKLITIDDAAPAFDPGSGLLIADRVQVAAAPTTSTSKKYTNYNNKGATEEASNDGICAICGRTAHR